MIYDWFSNITDHRWWAQFLHPGELRDKGGYWFYSGIFALSYIAGVFTILWTVYKRANCHADGCWRIGWHHDEAGHGHLLCKRHHPHGDAMEHYIMGIHHLELAIRHKEAQK